MIDDPATMVECDSACVCGAGVRFVGCQFNVNAQMICQIRYVMTLLVRRNL